MSADTASKSITLYFCQGNSDKVYQVRLEPQGSGFVVNFAFGRRGSTLQAGTKTNKPLDYQSALKIYDKLVREKMAKGYTPGQDSAPYQGSDLEEKATGILPQLLNAIDQEQAEKLITANDWWMQEKFDGKRILIRKQEGQVTGINRKGLVASLPQPIVQYALALDGQWLMDGEAVGEVYFAFDLLEKAGTDLRQAPYIDRLTSLGHMLQVGGDDPIRLAKTVCSVTMKRELLDQFRRENREGVVFKRSTAPYTPGRPARGGDQLKLKFTSTASCIVTAAHRTKRSVALGLFDGKISVAVGNVTIPANQAIPKAGSIVDIRYLYAYPGGSLFQPVYLVQRDDLEPAACTLSQLKYKPSTQEEEAEEE